MNQKLKRLLPRNILSRLLLIFLVPLVLVQCAVIFFFYERHWDKIINRFSNIASNQINLLVSEYKENGIESAKKKALMLSLNISKGEELQTNVRKSLLERKIESSLKNRVDKTLRVYFEKDSIRVFLVMDEIISLKFPRKYLLSETPIILFLWMVSSSLILSLIAFLFLRIQVRAIRRLAKSAEEFGEGNFSKKFKPEGASEIRMAGSAFLKMRQRIRNYINQRTAFLAGISHDLGTLITRIKLQLELMKNTKEIKSIKNDINTMQVFLDEYLNYSKQNRNEKTSMVNINELINNVINTSKEIKAKIKISCKPNLIIKVYKNSLFRIIFNLLENASKYGNKIFVQVKFSKTLLRIDIHDDGPGVPEQYKKKIFRPFFKIDSSRNLNQSGSGLGLSIADELANKMNASINVFKSKKYKGSCFSVKLKT